MTAPPDNPRALLIAAFERAVAAALPEACMDGALPPRPKGRTVVIGAGKAASAMVQALEARWDGPLEGLVLTRHRHRLPTRRVEVVEAGHPVPDRAGMDATRRLMDLVAGTGPDDLIIGLFSGGGSSLLCAPAPPLTLADKQALNRALLASGAPIDAMNTIRKHLSRIKGGRLPFLAPRTPVHALIMSDVPGDDMSTIASGPTVPDPTTLADARAAVERWRIPLHETARKALLDESNETPKADAFAGLPVSNNLILTPRRAFDATRPLLDRAGYEIVFLGDTLEGEARELGRTHGETALALHREGRTVCLLSGGETTVTVRGAAGRGGRNTEYLLGFALAVDGTPGIHALAADTDGIDGSETNAGAVMTPTTLARARRAGIDPAIALSLHDSYGVFAAAGDLVVTGPTNTNVNDFRAVLVNPQPA